MSDSEDFLFRIDAEELFPEEESALSEPKKIKLEKKKRKKKKMKLAKLAKIVPNHFIGFQIYDSMIRQRIADVQNKITEKNPLLKKALIDVRTLHITLAVTHLENEERITELRNRLNDWGENEMKSHFSKPIHLTFKGIGTFRKDVAFVKINECENYKRLCDLAIDVNDFLSKSGFYADNKRKYTPHLTLLKLSKNYKLFKNRKKFSDDFEVLNEFQDDFGCQDIKGIQLLSMNAKKDDNGYYKCLWRLDTAESAVETEVGSTE